MDAVIKETLRLTPIVIFVARSLSRPMRLGGVHLPAGVRVLPSIWLAHHDPAVWPDPDQFQPERWLGRKLDPYTWFPFGGGARRCLGMAFANFEMKLVLAELFGKYRVELALAAPVRPVRRGITFAPSGGVPARILAAG
jgi:cytochrome P450